MTTPSPNSGLNYPSLGDAAYSLFQWKRQKNLLLANSNEFYLCGQWRSPSKGAEDYALWSQQAELNFRFNGRLNWQGAVAEPGEWVAVQFWPEFLKSLGNEVEEKWVYQAQELKVLRLAPRREEIKKGDEASPLRFRSQFLNKLEETLTAMGLERVETPYLVANPGMEPSLEPFAMDWSWGENKKTYFLPTSPELHLKKLLARGWTDIFEVKTCFRNSEFSDHHQPEFQMLEWYRAFKDLGQIERDLQGLLSAFYQAGMIQPKEGESGEPQIKKMRYSELFLRFLDFELRPQTSSEDLRELCRKQQIHFTPEDSWNDLFFRLSLEKIEPHLESLGPLLITHFPPSQSALARCTPDGWADRFEFYWRGLEIANAFHELNDPDEQNKRFSIEIEERKKLGTRYLEPDWDFLKHLKAGMPPAAGVALGVERLMMACGNISKLSELRAFSFSCPY